MPDLTKRGFKKPLATEGYDLNIVNFNTDNLETELDKVSTNMEHKADLIDGKVPSSQLPEISSSADSITITDSAGNFTSNNVEGALAECFQYANDGKIAIKNAISNKGVAVTLEDTFLTLAAKITAQMCKFRGTAVVDDVLASKTFINSTGQVLTGTMVNHGAISKSLTTQNGSYSVPTGYHNGSGKVTANISNLIASNIKNGVNVGGVVGTYSPYQIYQGEYTYVNPGGGSPTQINVPNLPFVPDYIEAYVISLTANLYVGYGLIDNLSASLKSIGISKDYPGFSTLSQLINSGNFISRSDTVNYSDTYKSSYGITNVGTDYFKIQTQVPYNGDYKVVYTLKKYL